MKVQSFTSEALSNLEPFPLAPQVMTHKTYRSPTAPTRTLSREKMHLPPLDTKIATRPSQGASLPDQPAQPMRQDGATDHTLSSSSEPHDASQRRPVPEADHALQKRTELSGQMRQHPPLSPTIHTSIPEEDSSDDVGRSKAIAPISPRLTRRRLLSATPHSPLLPDPRGTDTTPSSSATGSPLPSPLESPAYDRAAEVFTYTPEQMRYMKLELVKLRMELFPKGGHYGDQGRRLGEGSL